MAKDRKLSSEDRILWGKVARTTRPLPGRMEDLVHFEEPEIEKAPESQQPANFKDGRSLLEALGVAPEPPKPTQHQHHPLEKPVKRKLARGHLQLEARVDLHGMIQSEAHGFLLHFLMRAHDRGLRHVLVITGKGTSLGSEGTLKRAVPMWFSLPEFRSLISSYEPAARTHGGEGALYVRLSRARGAAP
ncbi:DNA-nicking Smr family endonuclease [Pararhizobium capsulatum DSM 1112]|uniref:DNA-nicking Smr family endonuclease n=1 Tax=Pararhizobium capsulatum DSM 1112 TaxID=1121113 RepID=A0ABU0BIY5_9HYPH|nr:Smr/MutS family protein [Pararhizobium capsulatum]MDQ0318220.1 DNA-nicking Smr family endonuclease [Pararhizobium capsulatum DSM 1112]